VILADNFGLKIGVEGEKEFKNALRDINQSFKVLGSEMSLVSSEFDKNDKSIQALSARNTVLNKEIDMQKEKIAVLKDALDNASASFGENDKRTKNWQIQLNKAEAGLAGMEKELKNNNSALMSNADRYDALSKEIDETVKEYIKVKKEYGENSTEAKALEARLKDLAGEQREAGKAADEEEKQVGEVTKSLDQYKRGTKDAADETEKAESKFAAVGEALKTTAKVIAGVVTAVGTAAAAVGAGMFKMAESAAATGKEINNTSQKLGLSREGFQEWEYILKKSGTSIDIMGTGMKTLQKTMGGLTEDGDSASKAFADIGIKFDEIKGKTPEEALNMTIKALQDMPAGADRTAAALKLFGKGAMELQPLLNKTSEETDALRQRAHDLGLIMSEEQVDAAGKLNSAMGRAKDTVSGMKMQISNALLPAFADGISAFLDFAQGAEGGEEKMKSAVDNMVQAITVTIPQMVEKGAEMISALVTGISQALPGIVGAISDALPQIIGVITEMVPKLVAVIMEALPIIVSALLTALPMLADAAVQIILALVNGLSGMLPQLIPVAIDAIKSIVEGLIQNLSPLLDAALELILALADGILTAIPSLVEALPAIIIALVDFIIEAIPQIIEAGIQLLTSLVEALPTIITAIVEAIPLIINGILTALTENLPLIVQAGIDLLTALVDALPEIIEAIVVALPEIIDGILTAILDAIPLLIDAGIQLLVSLVDALPEIITAIVEAIPQIIDGIITAVIDAVPLLIEAGIKLIISLVQALPQIITTIVEAIPKIISGIINALVGNIDKIIMAGVQLFVSLIENLPTIIVEIVKAIPQIIKGLVDAIIGFVPKLAETGLNLIKGLWQGISDAGAWLWDKISGFFGGVVDKIKNFFGIHSPSTLFAELGGNMGEGIGVGFEKAMEHVSEDMKKAIPTSLDAPDVDINAGIHTAVNGAADVSLADLGLKLDGLTELIAGMLPTMLEALNIRVVLDDGTLVGRLAPEINKSLGILRRQRAIVG